MRLESKAVLVFLAVSAVFNPAFLGLYLACGVLLVSGVFVRKRFASKPDASNLSFPHSVLGVTRRRMRRFVRSADMGGESVVLKNVASKRLLVGFVTVAIVALLAGVVIGVTMVQYRLNGSGKIVIPPGLGVYSDAACTVPASSLDFGSFSPGENVTRTLYIRNEGSETGVLSLATQNWVPLTAKEYLAFSWNCEGTELAGGGAVEASFNIRALNTLTNESGITTFSFEAVISITLEA